MASSPINSAKDNIPLLSGDNQIPPLTKEDSQKPTYRLYNRRWLILIAYCMLTLSSLSQWFAFTTISNILQKYYRVNMIAINWLSMIYELMFIPFAIPFSFMLQKCGLGFTMVIAAFLNALGAVIRYSGGRHRDGFWLLFIGSTAGGLSTAAFLFLKTRIAAIWFGKSERAMATGIAVAASALGLALGFFQSAAMVRNHEDVELIGNDLNQFLLSVALSSVITFIFVCLVVRDKPPTPPSLSEAANAQNYGSLGAKVSVHDNLAMEKSNTCELNRRKIDDEESISIQKSGCEYIADQEINLHENNSVTWNCKNMLSPQINSLPASIMEDECKKIVSKCNNDNANVRTILSFKNDTLALMKNTGFQLILHLHAIATIEEIIWLTLLNELLIPTFPGMEFQIGTTGALSQLTGMLANFVVGPILDRTQSFRKITISVFAIPAILMVTFAFTFSYTKSFYWLSGLICIISGLSNSYFTISLDHIAELMYPIPEGSSAVILIVGGLVYGLIFANITSLILFKMGPIPIFVIMTLFYAFGAILALPLKDKGPRSSVTEDIIAK